MGSFFKTLLTLFFIGLILGASALSAGFYWAKSTLEKPILLNDPLRYEITRGSSLNSVAYDLADKGLLETPYLFHFASRILKQDEPIKAGEYEITIGMSAQDILSLFQDGSNIQYFITIPEGLTSYQIVQQLNVQTDLTGEVESIPVEGRLLPETYSYQKGEKRSAILARMEKALQTVLDEAWETRADNLPFDTKGEALILASIIEKETGVAGERGKVSGVFINRLRKGMLLQTDPTVIYALTGGEHKDEGKGPLGRRLLTKDLQVDNPYNTYKYPGLPPGPIANAGAASIKAALNPEDHQYLYFVADGTGGHAFGKTLSEHNRNVAKWRKIRRAQN